MEQHKSRGQKWKIKEITLEDSDEIYIFCLKYFSVESLDSGSREELYGLGTTESTTTASSRVNNTQASTADLRILQQRELHLLRQRDSQA